MSDEDAFVRAILADPINQGLRLLYADWLEERGDPRAEYLRLRAALDGQPPAGTSREALLARAEALQAALDPGWVALMYRGRINPRREASEGDYPRSGRRRRRREVTEADVGLFLRQYARKAHRGHDPNDRHYSRAVERKVKRMKAEELDRLIRGEGDQAEPGDAVDRPCD
jgi:uncharacterized protein (TIGR02996 family)